MTRAAVYIRLSQETAETTSPARQREACLRLVEERGWTLHEVYEDLDISGYSGAPRPGFDRLLGALEEVDVLVVWKLDRLYRRFVGFVDVLGRLETAGVELVSATESLDTTTPMGKGVAGIIAAQAEQESANTATRVTSAQEHLVAQGRWRGGMPPYGWVIGPHPSGSGRWAYLDPDTAPVTKEIVQRLLTGEAALSVAHDLNRRGVPTRKGTSWTPTTILSTARNPALCGWQQYRSEIVRDDQGHPVPAADALIDPATRRRLLAVVGDPTVGTKTTARRRDATLLSGVLRCGVCESPLNGWRADKHGAGYRCSRRERHGPTAHAAPVTISRRMLDRAVVAAIRTRLEATDYTTVPRPTEVDPHGRERERIAAALERLDDDRTAGVFDGASGDLRYRRQVAKLTARLKDLDVPAERGPSLADIADGTPDWDDWDDVQQRAAVGALIDVLVVNPVENEERAVIRWRDGSRTVLGL